MDTPPPAMLQENLIALLIWSPTAAPIISNTIEWSLFADDFRVIAKKSYEYLQKYQRPPKDHIADLFQPELEGKDKRHAARWRILLRRLNDSLADIDEKFVLDKLADFIRQQRMSAGILRVADRLRMGGTLALDEAEKIWSESVKGVLKVFDPGVQLSDMEAVAASLERSNQPSFHTGISALDVRGLGPRRKELHLFIAPLKRGKSWWLTHIGRTAWLMDRARVLHITLEISQEQMVGRYIQNLLSVAKREGQYQQSHFKRAKEGPELTVERLESVLALSKDSDKAKILEKLGSFGARLGRIIIKEFPTGGLTIQGLRAYLDTLEMHKKWIPDILVLDYADLMKIDTTDYRISLGTLYKELRGIAVERNLALVTASQSNREGLKAKTVSESHVGEDISKAQTADTVFTYSRTIEEKVAGLARLTVMNSRSEEDGLTLLLAQNYPLGQFVVDSFVMYNGYFDQLKGLGNGKEPVE